MNEKGLGMKKIKSKAEIFVEQTNFLKTIGTFPQDSRPLASIHSDGDCMLHAGIMTAKQAVDLANWLIETFKKDSE
jgi:hypothetical protein